MTDGTVTRRAAVVALGTLASRSLGALRDVVIAARFQSSATDLFFIAFTIPNALRVLLGEGAASAAFVPVFSEVREKRGAEASTRFLQNILGALLVVLAVVTALGVLLAEPLVMLYTDRLDEDRLRQTVDLTRVTFPYIFFMGLAALGAGALHAHGRFWAPSFA
ncbi:MAG: lipid II flippase MurJ, partial [Myxococcota bacterium]